MLRLSSSSCGSLRPHFVVFLVANFFPELPLFYCLECSCRHIFSWMAEQFFCVALSWRSFPLWTLSNSLPVGVRCSSHLLVLCGFLDLKQTLSLSTSESRRVVFQSSVASLAKRIAQTLMLHVYGHLVITMVDVIMSLLLWRLRSVSTGLASRNCPTCLPV